MIPYDAVWRRAALYVYARNGHHIRSTTLRTAPYVVWTALKLEYAVTWPALDPRPGISLRN